MTGMRATDLPGSGLLRATGQGAWWPTVVGPLLTLGTAGVVEALARTPLYLPVPHPLMLTAVVYATFVGGRRAGLASVAIMVAYTAYYFSLPGQLLRFSPENLRRILVLCAVSPIMVAVVDVLKRRSEAAIAARDELDRSRAEFLAAVTHQVRAPLTNVRGAVECLRLRHPQPDRPTARALEILDGQVAVLDRLVASVLETARIEEGGRVLRPAPVELAAAVGAAADRVARTGGGRPDLGAAVDPGLAVLADPDALVDVLTNLLDNAAKYGRGSRIEVTARPVADRVAVTVTDGGPGLPPAELERVFGKFHRVDGSDSQAACGYGLGLYICRQLVEAQGGRVRAANAPGGGAAFTVELPAAGVR